MRAIARIALTFIVVGGVVSDAGAQQVTSDRILLHDGGEFVPRFTDLPNVLVVPEGETVTLPPDSSWDAIEVAGTLRVSRAHDTTCRFIHLTILPGGTLDMGTVDDPILTRVEFIVRDVPIDTTKDPYQWGNGLINFGHQSRVGRTLEHTWTELTEDVEAGATTLRLQVPEGWQVGDALLLPDSRQVLPDNRNRPSRAPIRREPELRIAALTADSITLSGPVTFEHLSILEPDGAVVLRPRVANLSRNIVIRSENPDGVRGHTVNTAGATWDIRYNQLIGLGRTRADNLDSTTADPESGRIVHVGTNQIARYASHDHHVHSHGAHGPHASHIFIGNTLEGRGTAKWAHVVHGTHDTHVEENIALDFVGAGFVTEDGYEVRNVFRRNVAAYMTGNGISAINNVDARRKRNSPGGEGAGFWFRGLHQTVEGNEAWNNIVGFNLFPRDPVLGREVPGAPGKKPDTAFDPREAKPVVFENNVAFSNSMTGVEYWNTRRFPVARQISAYNGKHQVFMGQSGADLYLTDVTLVAAGGITDAISSSQAYTASVEVDGGRIVGTRRGVQRGGGRTFLHLRDLVMQNRTNVIVSHDVNETVLDNVRHVPLGSFGKQYVVIKGAKQVWEPGTKPPRVLLRDWLPQRGTHVRVINWQGTGVDYRLYSPQQRREVPVWSADTASFGAGCPVSGLSMGECWDQFGMAYGGGVVGDDEAVELEGLVNGVGAIGRNTRLGTPRTVLLTPGMSEPVRVDDRKKKIRLRFALTGDPELANDVAVVKVDDDRAIRSRRGPGHLEEERVVETDALKPGVHTVRTWREGPDGKRIPESELTFSYLIEQVDGERTASNGRQARR
jgi:hypothetical protein